MSNVLGQCPNCGTPSLMRGFTENYGFCVPCQSNFKLSKAESRTAVRLEPIAKIELMQDEYSIRLRS